MKRQPRTYHETIGNGILEEPDYIIAIGASAGGLEAIHEFFDNMTDPGNYSFVVIQHLSPDYKSLLVELVSKHTRMKVLEAEHNVVLQKRCVYIIPNNKVMTIKQGKVQLVQKAIEKAPIRPLIPSCIPWPVIKESVPLLLFFQVPGRMVPVVWKPLRKPEGSCWYSLPIAPGLMGCPTAPSMAVVLISY